MTILQQRAKQWLSAAKSPYQLAMEFAEEGYTIAQTTAAIGSFPGGDDRWGHGVVSPQGNIYFMPSNRTSILKLATATDTTSQITGVHSSSGQYIAGALSPNGFIYGIPQNATQVLKINPANDTFSLFGSVGTAGTPKYRSCACTPGGIIYALPWDGGPQVLKINTNTDAISTISLPGSVPNVFQRWWYGCSVSPQNNIYAPPLFSNRILKLATATDTITQIGPDIGNFTGGYAGSVTAPNGFIYCIPNNRASILKIDPATDTVTSFGSFTGSNKWQGGSLGPDGLIYCSPNERGTILVINPANDSTSEFSATGGAFSITLSVQGNLYSSPFNRTTIRKVGANSLSLPIESVTSPYVNTF